MCEGNRVLQLRNNDGFVRDRSLSRCSFRLTWAHKFSRGSTRDKGGFTDYVFTRFAHLKRILSTASFWHRGGRGVLITQTTLSAFEDAAAAGPGTGPPRRWM